jgi:outer membrane protein assembly factor BamB
LFADRRRRKLRWALAGGAVATLALFVLGAVLLPQLMRAQTPALPIAGDHLWATTRRDMQGTLRSAVTGLTQPTANLVFSHTAGYAGGPVITRDGMLIINTLDQYVQCIEPQGKLVWQTELAAVPIGAPTLGATDDVYVADVDGGLTRLTLQGQVIWRAEPGIKAPAMAGPLIDGRANVYVLTEGYLWSSDGQGNVRWQTPTPYTYFNTVPRLSLDQRTVFFADVALDAESGEMLLEPSVAPLDQFMTGAQGQMYLHTDTSLMEWRVTPQGIALVEATRLDYSRYFPNLAEADAGSVPGQSIWFLMSNEYLDARVIWSDYAGSYRGSVGFAQRPSRIVAIDRDFTLYACGRSTAREAQCIALEQGALEPRWKMALQQEDEVIGGALISGRLYITTRNGFLYALSDQA